MIHPTLWRVERQNADAEQAAIEHATAKLQAGLRTHVIHSPLLTVAMRVGEQERAYVVLEGCPGCPDRCRIGCPAALFRRMLDSQNVGLTLRAVAPPQGLARRPYARGAFAWPRPGAKPLDSTLLQPWPEARLAIFWRRYGSAICGSLLLLAGADGPSPRAVLQSHGWRACAAPPLMLRRWGQAALPPALPFGAPWPRGLFLLLPPIVAVNHGGASHDAATA